MSQGKNAMLLKHPFEVDIHESPDSLRSWFSVRVMDSDINILKHPHIAPYVDFGGRISVFISEYSSLLFGNYNMSVYERFDGGREDYLMRTNLGT